MTTSDQKNIYFFYKGLLMGWGKIGKHSTEATRKSEARRRGVWCFDAVEITDKLEVNRANVTLEIYQKFSWWERLNGWRDYVWIKDLYIEALNHANRLYRYPKNWKALRVHEISNPRILTT